jgi:hypothetical protein
MPVQVAPVLSYAKVDLDRMTHPAQEVIKRESTPETRPREDRQPKDTHPADAHDYLYRLIKVERIAASSFGGGGELFEEERQGSGAQNDREGRKPRTHASGEHELGERHANPSRAWRSISRLGLCEARAREWFDGSSTLRCYARSSLRD